MESVTIPMTYYRSGFFGLSTEVIFKPYTIAHFVPILLAIAAIILIWRYRDAIRNWKHERDFRFIYAFVMIIVEMSYFWRLQYVGPGMDDDTTMMGFLPLQVCQWTLILTTFMMMSKSKRLFSMSFFMTMSVGLLPLMVPAVISYTGPAYYRYYQFWCEHLLPIIGMFYMMFVHGYEAKPSGIFMTLGFLVLLALPCIYFNEHFEDSEYMYLKHSEYDMLSFLPESPYLTLLILLAAVLILLGLTYLIYGLVTGKFRKAKTQEAVEQ
ncbi:MAG: TIGR02206 family membrane protein [Spirochaetales bacterium]|nr:TIGR02206 family membrane protein [Spirochaetales bacterium]